MKPSIVSLPVCLATLYRFKGVRFNRVVLLVRWFVVIFRVYYVYLARARGPQLRVGFSWKRDRPEALLAGLAASLRVKSI